MFGGDSDGLDNAIRKLRFGRGARFAALIAAADYQCLLTEAPGVPAAELKAAMKWRLKELIDYPVDQACYDVLAVPMPEGSSGHTHSAIVVTAKNETLRKCVSRFEEAGVEISVIDVQETAQRNISALCEDDNRGLGLLYLDDRGALFTITFRSELYLARRFEIGMNDVLQASGDAREAEFARILLELQRTLDNFERQFSFVTVSKVVVGPQPEETGLVAYLNANLGVRVEAVDIGAMIDREQGVVLDADTQWRLFHPIGCSFRTEARTA